MKPNFALTLSFKGIGLLHRTQPGWHLVGEVGLDSEDLAGDLARLASTARMLNPTGLHTKLVIPDEQIKYLSFATDSRDPDIIDAQVRNALDGATPYALADLTYDWSVSAGEVYVAAVARETLMEAESFAVEHAFAPVSFVAKPEAGHFEGEPFFGQTSHSRRILGPDERVERDLEAIRVVGAAKLPIPEPVAEAEAPAPQEPAETPAAPKSAPATATPAAESPPPAEKKPASAAPEKAPPAATPTASEPAAGDESEPASGPVAFTSIRAVTPRAGKATPEADAPPALPKSRFSPAAPEKPRAAPAEPQKRPHARGRRHRPRRPSRRDRPEPRHRPRP
ncbi:MAG: hypothetical protein RIG84_14480, partial [Roseovarius sp.]